MEASAATASAVFSAPSSPRAPPRRRALDLRLRLRLGLRPVAAPPPPPPPPWSPPPPPPPPPLLLLLLRRRRRHRGDHHASRGIRSYHHLVIIIIRPGSDIKEGFARLAPVREWILGGNLGSDGGGGGGGGNGAAVEALDPMEYLTNVLTSRVYDVAIESPLQPATKLSERLGVNLYLKREDLQPVFSFKLRGAYNMMAKMSREQLDRELFAHRQETMRKELHWLLRN
uniref:Tryptophan synthase beta chain-like PALP domain-containing protein n=1 Tax=Ananas comosus var. bracteatus TaxID=296719 RepID=A0A6V7PNU3_ANACO|nr:unnamed protein product [Ananas comosus var. bracteatus]